MARPEEEEGGRFPSLSYSHGEFIHMDNRLDLRTEPADVRNDAALLTEFFNNYRGDFVGDVKRLQTDYFTFMSWFYFSPFLCWTAEQEPEAGELQLQSAHVCHPVRAEQLWQEQPGRHADDLDVQVRQEEFRTQQRLHSRQGEGTPTGVQKTPHGVRRRIGEPVTERLILEIHRHLVDGVRGGSAAPGQYRRVQNFIVNSATGETIYTPPPAQDVPGLMRKLVDWLNRPDDIHPVIVSGIAQFQLVHIQPFLDGNGRTSRLLSTLLLYRAGYDFKRLFTISEYYDRDRLAFYGALQSVRQSNMDMTGWVEYFTTGLATQLVEVKNRGELAIRQDVLSRRHELTDRQSRALGYILERGRATIGELESLFPEVARRTLQRDLRVLVEQGLILREGRTSRLEYVAVDEAT